MKFVFAFLLLIFSVSLNAQPKTIHVFVALCDNENQGIIPVPESLGNGQDPYNNLYWGAAYGLKNFFKNKNAQWDLLVTIKNVNSNVLERVLFKHKNQDVYLLADAYDGVQIRNTIIDFLNSCKGGHDQKIRLESLELEFGGSSDVLAYLGHNGLMEFDLDIEDFEQKNTENRQSIILACSSKMYFEDFIRNTGADPLIWTTGFMAPEAYTLDFALESWISGGTKEDKRLKAAEAYHKYQKCGINGAKRLLVTGW